MYFIYLLFLAPFVQGLTRDLFLPEELTQCWLNCEPFEGFTLTFAYEEDDPSQNPQVGDHIALTHVQDLYVAMGVYEVESISEPHPYEAHSDDYIPVDQNFIDVSLVVSRRIDSLNIVQRDCTVRFATDEEIYHDTLVYPPRGTFHPCSSTLFIGQGDLDSLVLYEFLAQNIAVFDTSNPAMCGVYKPFPLMQQLVLGFFVNKDPPQSCDRAFVEEVTLKLRVANPKEVEDNVLMGTAFVSLEAGLSEARLDNLRQLVIREEKDINIRISLDFSDFFPSQDLVDLENIHHFLPILSRSNQVPPFTYSNGMIQLPFFPQRSFDRIPVTVILEPLH